MDLASGLLVLRTQFEAVKSMRDAYDNASCESFIKTFKQEEIYANDYKNLEHLRSNIEEFIERYYNQKRLHSALGYRSPEEFEQDAQRKSEATTVGATVRFFLPSEEKASTLLAGEGTSNAVPSPDPIPAGESTRWTMKENNVGNCGKRICLARWVQFNERCKVSKGILSQRRGSPQHAVDEIEAAKASNFNKEQ